MTETAPARSLSELQASTEGLFAETLGIKFLEATPQCIRAELTITRELCTMPGIMHGGAIMAFADTLGAYGTSLNLAADAGTTTVESKTNFFAAGLEGTKIIGTCTPLHLGRRTHVWQTQVRREDGRLVAQITQTQIVLEAAKTPTEQLVGLFAGLSRADQQALLAQLEHAGGSMYQHWADSEADAAIRALHLAALEREEQNARFLEGLTKK
ncbi:MAG: 1,4-dihydroxy-2-naphthoyl-CoA hydrolase [Alphaproteobacteria bacterium]|nr:1,4-dihydroxy-2-naphthoyl-CoA hydrolase [Alphaproteobacteria bacterium]